MFVIRAEEKVEPQYPKRWASEEETWGSWVPEVQWERASKGSEGCRGARRGENLRFRHLDLRGSFRRY